MVSKKVLGALAASVFAFSMGAAQAQFTGGAQPQVTSVAQVINQARDNQYVSVQGYLTQKVGNEEYILRDSTGEILVDIDNHVFRGQQVTPQIQVLLHGEVDKDFGHQAEIDVDSLQIVR